MQATPRFFNDENNSQWFKKIEYPNGLLQENGSRRKVDCVQLTEKCKEYLQSITNSEQTNNAQTRAQALLYSDIEQIDKNSKSTILGLTPIEPPPSLHANAPTVCPIAQNANSNRASLLRALVEDIQKSPFQSQYRRQVVNSSPIIGWDHRLNAYFWPNPSVNYATTYSQLQNMLTTAKKLAGELQANQRWNDREQTDAIQLANDIFAWGGVPQRPDTVTAENVQAVFVDAFNGKADSTALMNSGWTKVAAFATAHLEDISGKPQVIWDSRVAASIISRLDRLIGETGNQPISIFPNIGTIPGRGGSRPRKHNLVWPNGYQKWTTQISGSKLVREMRDILNDPENKYPKMPLPTDNSCGAWTTRGVEMVLFMDGY
jgi:hypothetical protein